MMKLMMASETPTRDSRCWGECLAVIWSAVETVVTGSSSILIEPTKMWDWAAIFTIFYVPWLGMV